MARILLGVSGGIAAYKALELVRLATAGGHVLRVVQTPASRRFVGAASFAALSGAPALVSEFERDPARGAFPDQPPPAHEPPSHLELVAQADLYLIAPASANTIAKLAHGLADSLLGSCALAATCPLIVAPAMNNHMYEHPAVQANLDVLRARGVRIVPPGSGRLATPGEHGVGRLAEPAELLAVCEEVLAADGAGGSRAGRSWAGLSVLVTAGGTREPIDSVRFLGNSSSGRMGLALAAAARERALEAARAKLLAKHLDAIVVNDISRADIGFDSDHNEVTILTADASAHERPPADRGEAAGTRDASAGLFISRAPKTQVAEQILDTVERLRARS